MKNNKISYQFTIKSKEELRDLSHEELLKYIENLQDTLVQEYQRAKRLILQKKIKAPEKKVVKMEQCLDTLVQI